jgi:hypothetical protein
MFSLLGFCVLVCTQAWAQCAMCRTTAEANGAAGIAQGINLGILVLLFPPLIIFCGIFRAAYKSQQNTGQERV